MATFQKWEFTGTTAMVGCDGLRKLVARLANVSQLLTGQVSDARCTVVSNRVGLRDRVCWICDVAETATTVEVGSSREMAKPSCRIFACGRDDAARSFRIMACW